MHAAGPKQDMRRGGTLARGPQIEFEIELEEQ